MFRWKFLVVGGVLVLSGCGSQAAPQATLHSAESAQRTQSVSVSQTSRGSAVVSTTVATTSTVRTDEEVVDGFIDALYTGNTSMYQNFANTRTAPMDPFYSQNLKMTGVPNIEKISPQPNGLTSIQFLVPATTHDGKMARYRFFIDIQNHKVFTYIGSELLEDS